MEPLTVPFTYLEQAAHYAAGKADIRYYLRGVYVSPHRIEATDGATLLRIPLDPGDIGPGVIVPSEAIADLRRSLTPTQRKNASVGISEDTLSAAGKTIDYRPIDGRFPNTDSIMPKDESLCGTFHDKWTFNWSQMAKFSETAQALAGVPATRLRLSADGSSVARVYFPAPIEHFVGLIMPTRWK